MKIINGKTEEKNIESIAMNEIVEEDGFVYIKQKCDYFKQVCKSYLDDYDIHKKISKLTSYLISNPTLLVAFGIATFALVLPLLLLTIFIAVNIAVAFTGFVIIEAMVLTSGVTLFCCALFFITTIILISGISILLSYYGIYYVYDKVKKFLYA